jgi:hypothetical protein
MFTRKSKLNILKGGEKMRTLGLVLAMIVVVTGAAIAETATMDVYTGWNLIGPPCVPLDSNPVSVFSNGNPSGVDIEYTDVLTRLDAPSQGYIDYLFFDPASFGGVLLGEGYFLNASVDTQVQFDGLTDGVPSAGIMTDMWISLPGNQMDGQDAGGWHIISNPFNHGIPFNEVYFGYDGANIKVTDGVEMKTLLDAATAGWIDEPFSYLNGASQGYESAGYLSGVYESDELEPGKGYFVKTNRDNLALIIPAVRPY